jgi:hypothetical protein
MNEASWNVCALIKVWHTGTRQGVKAVRLCGGFGGGRQAPIAVSRVFVIEMVPFAA